MAYSFRRKDKSVEHALCRIARSQIDKAVISIDEDSHATAVHEVRKRCKKIRGLIRLVRPAFDQYQSANEFFRDTARLVAGYRDAKVMQDTYDSLTDRSEPQIERNALQGIRGRFTLERKGLLEGRPVNDALADCRARLLDARKEIPDWSLDADGWEAIGEGLSGTYARALALGSDFGSGGDCSQFHELRKQVNYHWMHTRLLHRMQPRLLRQRARTAAKLVDLLGDHHDLSIYEERLRSDASGFGEEEDVEVMTILVRRHRVVLAHRAMTLSQRLLSETPEELGHRWRDIWHGWKEGGEVRKALMSELC